MIDRVMQTITGPGGNCMQAAVASLLRLPLEAVPHFFGGLDDEDPQQRFEGWQRFDRFFERFGMHMATQRRGDQSASVFPHIAAGKSPRGLHHACIYQGFDLLHDPHPEGGGVIVDTRYALQVHDVMKLGALDTLRREALAK